MQQQQQQQQPQELSGTVYKLSDYLKIWNKRYCVLSDGLFLYYSTKTSPVPRGYVYLSQECTIQVSNEYVGDGYYAFVIAHPKSGQHLMFATTSMAETRVWVESIQNAMMSSLTLSPPDPNSSNSSTAATNSSTRNNDNNNNNNNNTLSSSLAPDTITASLSSSIITNENPVPITHAPLDENEPNEDAPQMRRRESSLDVRSPEEIINELLNKVVANSEKTHEMWRHEKKLFNTTVYTTAFFEGQFDDAVAMSERVIDAPPKVVWDVIWSRRSEFDPTVSNTQIIEQLGIQTRIEQVLHLKLWPTLPREFVRITAWRVLNDGTIAIISGSIHHPSCPLQPKLRTRAYLNYSGYLISNFGENRSLVTFIVDVDLKMSKVFPKAIERAILTGYVMSLERIAEIAKHTEIIDSTPLENVDSNTAGKVFTSPATMTPMMTVQSSAFTINNPLLLSSTGVADSTTTTTIRNNVTDHHEEAQTPVYRKVIYPQLYLALTVIPLWLLNLSIIVYSLIHRYVGIREVVTVILASALSLLILIEARLPRLIYFLPIWETPSYVSITKTIKFEQKIPSNWRILVIQRVAKALGIREQLHLVRQQFAYRPVTSVNISIFGFTPRENKWTMIRNGDRMNTVEISRALTNSRQAKSYQIASAAILFSPSNSILEYSCGAQIPLMVFVTEEEEEEEKDHPQQKIQLKFQMDSKLLESIGYLDGFFSLVNEVVMPNF